MERPGSKEVNSELNMPPHHLLGIPETDCPAPAPEFLIQGRGVGPNHLHFSLPDDVAGLKTTFFKPLDSSISDKDLNLYEEMGPT